MCVFKAQQTAFVCVANVRWTAERYLFGVSTLEKNTFTMLGIHLTRRTPNKALFGIRSHSRADVNIPIEIWSFLPSSGACAYQTVDTHCVLTFCITSSSLTIQWTVSHNIRLLISVAINHSNCLIMDACHPCEEHGLWQLNHLSMTDKDIHHGLNREYNTTYCYKNDVPIDASSLSS